MLDRIKDKIKQPIVQLEIAAIALVILAVSLISFSFFWGVTVGILSTFAWGAVGYFRKIDSVIWLNVSLFIWYIFQILTQ